MGRLGGPAPRGRASAAWLGQSARSTRPSSISSAGGIDDAVAQEGRAPDDVAELAHVARPAVGGQTGAGGVGQRARAHLLGHLGQEVLGQRHDVGAAARAEAGSPSSKPASRW